MHTEHELLEIAQETATVAWASFSHLYKKVGDMPKIIMNRRLKTTAGRCDFDARVIDLSPSLMLENVSEFKRVIIPHELAHQVAWDVYKDSGHGSDWKSVMEVYGLPPERCHNLVSSTYTPDRKPRAELNPAEFRIGDKVSFVHTNRQKVKTNITGPVTKINLKTLKMINSSDGIEWTVPFSNNCNLRKV